MAGLKTTLGTIGDSIVEALARARRAAGGAAPITGLPTKPLMVGGQQYIPGPSGAIRQAAEAYMRGTGREYVPVQNYVPTDVERARAIARAFEETPHAPTDPAVQRSWQTMAKETKDQYESLKKMGFTFEPIPAGAPDPYAATPRMAIRDLIENKHMFYFPTEGGFGSGEGARAAMEAQRKINPMLQPSGVRIGGQEVPNNDLFRIVHDVYGHAKEGVGFRAAGEENAWRSHARMYSPEALPAMTMETRGQNNWLNYGPHGDFNRTASAANTIYADQKMGMLPDWVINLGRMSPLGVAGAVVGGRTLADMAAEDGR